MNNDLATREEMIRICQRINASDLNLGTAGNLSVRVPGGLLITPSGIPYDSMRADQIVEMDDEGRYYGDTIPSSEWRFHFDILKSRPDANAVLHSHAPNASILACCRLDIEAVHYMVGVSGGSVIKCSGYAPFGTPDLSRLALEALGDRNACLLGNHGVIAVGPTPGKALDTLQVVEYLARVSIGARMLGQGVVLPDADIAVVLKRFRTYGKQASELTPADLADPDRVMPPERAGDRLGH
jgi:L-fuculose-phosphate aldolase